MDNEPFAICQWNLNSFKAQFNSLLSLIYDISPSIIALQETKLLVNNSFRLKDYNVITKNREHRRGGGVALCIHKSINFSNVIMSEELEAITITVHLQNMNLSICSIYIPPTFGLQIEHLYRLIDKMEKNYILLGDFNAHHPIWGSPFNSSAIGRGKIITEFIKSQNLTVLNDGSPTYISDISTHYSHIDLSLCTEGISNIFTWETLSEAYGSDHFPILITIPTYKHEKKGICRPKWIIKDEGWNVYRKYVKIPVITSENIDAYSDKVTESIIEAASISFKLKKQFGQYKANVWWNEDCKKAVIERRKAFRKFKSNPIQINFINYKKARAQARRIVKLAKTSSWKNYVESLTFRNTSKEVWKKLRCFTNQSKSKTKTSISLKIDNCVISNKADVANLLVQHYAYTSSLKVIKDPFATHMTEQEFNPIIFNDKMSIELEQPFTIHELERQLQNSKDSSPGEDLIMYSFLKNLPNIEKLNLLKFYNHIWVSDTFPSKWKISLLLPILKPGKPKLEINSYRPIALTSVLCKTMEKMIALRLNVFLEENNILNNYQSGFRKRYSTMDSITRLENDIRIGFLKCEYTVGIFMDVEKAYDSYCLETWTIEKNKNNRYKWALREFFKEFHKK